MPTPARRISTFGTTVFTEINMLAQQYNALNLGQGKPDFDTPPDIVAQMVQAARAGQYNQYAPGSGTASLRQAIASHAARFYDLEIDPANGVVVTSGATEGIFSAILGLVDPGDEVIVIEPFYDFVHAKYPDGRRYTDLRALASSHLDTRCRRITLGFQQENTRFHIEHATKSQRSSLYTSGIDHDR